LTKCRYCSEEGYGLFKLTAITDGIEIRLPLCVPDALLIQSQGYRVELVQRYKEGENKDEKV